MMRFVEVCIGTGSLIPRFKPEKKRTRFHPIIGLEAERSVMYTQSTSVDIMMHMAY
jgi:hypothetical protein